MTDERVNDEDLAPTETEGYKPPAAKTVEELKALDKDDAALTKWKESLLKNSDSCAPNDDARRVVVASLAMETAGRPDVVLDLSTPEKIKNAKDTAIVIKEGVEFRMKIQFRVQHEVVSGLKYLHVVKRKGIRVDKTEEMIGSYAPQVAPYEKKFAPEQAPSGILARGHYVVRSKCFDDDKTDHLDFEWSFDIKKEWEDQ